jgi:thiamine kinase-like enzyme
MHEGAGPAQPDMSLRSAKLNREPATDAATTGSSPLESEGDFALARSVISRLDFFCSERPEEVALSRLGGLTNTLFRADCNGDSYVLRIPGKGSEEYIDRRMEAHAAREAARVGVAPEVIVADPVNGLMVTAFVSAATMGSRLFRSTPGAPGRSAALLKRLHESNARFKFRYDLFRMIDEYMRVLAGKRIVYPEGLREVLRESEGVRRALAARRLPSVACHCDPLPENFLDDGERMWLVDWEYSGMNDPMWDLAVTSVEGGFRASEEGELLAAYFDNEPAPVERGRITLYKAMCDLMWSLWGLIQHANGSPADDFWAYATARLRRCQALVSDRSFAQSVGLVLKG